MAHRLNIMLDDEVWGVLEKTPRGERSRIINAALEQWFRQKNRNEAVRKMEELRGGLPPVSTEEIVSWLRVDRERSE